MVVGIGVACAPQTVEGIISPSPERAVYDTVLSWKFSHEGTSAMFCRIMFLNRFSAVAGSLSTVCLA